MVFDARADASVCDLCLKHGAGAAWYLNARSYTGEVAATYDLRAYLGEQYRNFEQISVRPLGGISPVGMDRVFRMPIIGRMVKRTAERMLHSTRAPKNPLRPEGHIGQVVPLEDGIAILERCAAEPLIQKNCMCRYMSRGIKEPCCINFGVMSEIIDQLPRFIPEKEKYHLGRAEAVARFTEFNRRGYIGTIWYGPFPYINNLCSCQNPECAGIRPRLDFGITSIYKAEYVIGLRRPSCTGCLRCVRACPFGALSVDGPGGGVAVNAEACWGCGVCRHACDRHALYLRSRDEVHETRGKY